MIAWVDLETSGLVPGNDSILEFVCVVTDDFLRVIDTFGPFVVEPSILAKSMDRWDDVVIKMHNQNGLIEALQYGTTITPEELDDNCVDWLRLSYPDEKMPLAGSTIGFDRAFMKTWLPRTERYFHYRSIDISSIKELCKRWNTLVYDLRPTVPDEEKAHRALPDILASIEEAKYYRDKLFQQGDSSV